MHALFCRKAMRPMVGLYRVPRHWSFDQDLEGARSLGAVLIDTCSVLPQQAMRPKVGLYRVPRLQGTAALQVREGPLEL